MSIFEDGDAKVWFDQAKEGLLETATSLGLDPLDLAVVTGSLFAEFAPEEILMMVGVSIAQVVRELGWQVNVSEVTEPTVED